MDRGQRHRKFYQSGGRASGEGAQDQNDDWLQRLIACALSLGISKRELLADYYMDEIGLVIKQWNQMHNPHATDDQPEQVDAMTFMGDGGEWV